LQQQCSVALTNSRHPCLLAACAAALFIADAPRTQAQISPDQVRQVRAAIANQIGTLTILGGDFGFTGGSFTLTNELAPGERVEAQARVRKFGGEGDIGDPRPIDGGKIAWQPHVQGSMGFIDSVNDLQSDLLKGDSTELKARAIEFGGGARLWLSDSLSVAATIAALYGHTSDTYRPRSVFALQNIALLQELGLVDWHADVWAIRPAINIQYVAHVGRSIIKLSAEPTYFHTQGLSYSNPHIAAGANSGFVASTVDVDVPLGIEVAGYELRTGGYLSRTHLIGDLHSSLDIEHLTEVHPRIVVGLLNRLWKVKWLGIGGSYVWGTGLRGWTAGVDAAFQF